MDVLLATPELAPVTSLGGIGEGLGALALALARRGDHVTVALPGFRLSGAAFEASRRPIAAFGSRAVSVLEGELAPRLRVAIVDAPGLSDREHIYGDDTVDVANAARFALFSRAVVELARERALAGAPFAILHAHEWPCAVIPYLAQLRPELAATRTILTLHNLAFQGVFPPAVLADLGLDESHLAEGRLGTLGHVSFTRGGIVAADVITTVSPTYAQEILRPPSGQGLEDALARRKDALVGLLNGIDQAVWDPAKDAAIARTYGRADTTGKAACKEALAAELGLRPDRPLVVSVGRVVRQKGSDLLAAAIPPLVDAGASVVVAGGGELPLAEDLHAAVARRPDHARYLGIVPDAQVHRLVAGADLVVMPSRFEPCGIVQMYAHRYGSIPVARRTGGLADTIEPLDAALERGSGFLFDAPTTDALVGSVLDALRAMASPAWVALRERVMAIDHGWMKRSAAYGALYRRLTLSPASPPGAAAGANARR